ncbi:MAG: hypothetical protein ACK519_10660 [Sphingomonadaceae bacterium]|jgi:hypothetical protein
MSRFNSTFKNAWMCIGFILSMSSVSVQANAQSETGPVILAPANGSVIEAGTEIMLSLREKLTTDKKKLKAGYRFQMAVAEPIRLNNKIIIPSGTPAIGEVTEVRNKGLWGKASYIEARVISMRIGGRTIRLSGAFDDKGAAGSDIIPVVGFFAPGSSATIAAGSIVKAFLDEDIVVAQPPAPAPAKPSSK